MNDDLTLNEKPSFFCKFSDFVWIIELLFALAAFALILRTMPDKHTLTEAAPYALLLIAVLAAVFAAARSAGRRSAVLAPALLMVFAVLSQVLAVVSIDSQPISDFGLMYNSALSAVNGDYSWLELQYYRNWAYQIPFVMYEALVLSVCNSLRALQIMNIFFAVGCIWLVYMLSALYLEQDKAVLAGFAYALCPAAFILTPVLTNQHISLFFMLLGIYVFLRYQDAGTKDRYISAAAAGALLAVGNLMRAEAVVIILSIIFCTLIYRCCRRGLKEILPAALLTLVYFALQFAVGKIFFLCGIAPYGIGNNVPQWKFVVGLDFITGGTYTNRNEFILSMSDNAARWQETISAIKRSHAEGMSITSLVMNKIRAFWHSGEPLYFAFTGGSDSVLGLDLNMFSKKFYLYERAYRLCLYLLAFASAVKMLVCRRREFCFALRLMTTIVCVLFVVYLLIEVQSRYRYVVNPFAVLTVSALLLKPRARERSGKL